MNRQIVGWAIAIALCFSVSFAYGQQRKRTRKRSPATNRRDRSSEQRTSEPRGRRKRQAALRAEIGRHARIAGNNRALSPAYQQTLNRGLPERLPRALRKKIKSTQPTGTQEQRPQVRSTKTRRRKRPVPRGSRGAAVANRNHHRYSGAQGAAAGAAAANRNSTASIPRTRSGGWRRGCQSQPTSVLRCTGAAVGAAVATTTISRNTQVRKELPLGAALANSNQPSSIPAQQASQPGAAMANSNQPQNSAAQAAAAGPQTPTAICPQRLELPAPRPDMKPCEIRSTPRTFTGRNGGAIIRKLGFPAGWIPGAAWHPTPWGAHC